MDETPFFFPGDRSQLFGILHRPTVSESHKGFVFCHPFAEEKLWAHRVFVRFARELAGRGYTVLRFDYMGHGDSEGDFQDSSVETRIADIRSALRAIRHHEPTLETIGLLGLRFGATLAAVAADRGPEVESMILWEPIVDGDRYMQDALRTNLTTQMAVYGRVTENRQVLIEKMRAGFSVNVDGYEVTYPLFEQASAIKLLSTGSSFSGRVLVAQIASRSRPIRKELDSLAQAYKHGGVVEAVEEPFWREIKRFYGRAEHLFAVTLDWLNEPDE